MKKQLLSIFLAILVCFATAVGATAANTITSYVATFHVSESGETAVSTQIKMTFDEAATQVVFPIGNGKNGEIAGYNADKITRTEGTALQLTNDAGFMGTQTFQISYDLMAPVENDSDSQILTLELLPAGYDYGITNLSYSVTLPQAFETVPTYLGGYRDQIVDNYLDLNQTDTTFSGEFLEPLLDHDSLVATLILPENFLDFNSANGLPTWLCLSFVAFFLLVSAFYWYASLFSDTPDKAHRTAPPEGIGAGDFPYFYHGKEPNFTMEILDFATKDILLIHRTGRQTITLQRSTGSAFSLPTPKKNLLKRLFHGKNHCAVKSREFHSISTKYASVMLKFWRKSTTAPSSGDPKILRRMSTVICAIAVLGSASSGLDAGNSRHLWLMLYFLLGIIMGALAQHLGRGIQQKRWLRTAFASAGILGLWLTAVQLGGFFAMIFAFLSIALSNYATISGKRKNAVGLKTVSQSKDYARFLSTATRGELLAELQADDQYFYNILPYAESIGLGKYLASQLKNVSLAPCHWLVTDGKQPRTASQFRNQLLQIIAELDGH